MTYIWRFYQCLRPDVGLFWCLYLMPWEKRIFFKEIRHSISFFSRSLLVVIWQWYSYVEQEDKKIKIKCKVKRWIVVGVSRGKWQMAKFLSFLLTQKEHNFYTTGVMQCAHKRSKLWRYNKKNQHYNNSIHYVRTCRKNAPSNRPFSFQDGETP